MKEATMRRSDLLVLVAVLLVGSLALAGCSFGQDSNDASSAVTVSTAPTVYRHDIDQTVMRYLWALASGDVARATELHEGGFNLDLSRASAFGRYASNPSNTFFIGPIWDEKVLGGDDPEAKPTGWRASAIVAVVEGTQIKTFTVTLSGVVAETDTVTGASVDSSAR
jgi:hypothetical protein